jgi:hypothetical protein
LTVVAELFKFFMVVLIIYYIWRKREAKEIRAPIYPLGLHNKSTSRVPEVGTDNTDVNANARSRAMSIGTGTIHNPRDPGGVGSSAVVMRIGGPKRMSKTDSARATTAGTGMVGMKERSADIWNGVRYGMMDPRKGLNAGEMERLRNPGGPPMTKPRSRRNSLLPWALASNNNNDNNSNSNNGNGNDDKSNNIGDNGKFRAKTVRLALPLPTSNAWNANAGSASPKTKSGSRPLNSSAWSAGAVAGGGTASATEKSSPNPLDGGGRSSSSSNSSSVWDKGSVWGTGNNDTATSAFGGSGVLNKGIGKPTALGPFR